MCIRSSMLRLNIRVKDGQLDSNAKTVIIGCAYGMKSFELFFGLNLCQWQYAHLDTVNQTISSLRKATDTLD